MDEIDNYLEKLVCQNVEVPESFEKAMREALFSEKFYKRLKKRKIIKFVVAICITLIIVSAIGYCGYIMYENNYKESNNFTYLD